jgi:hypothetical protein
MMELSSMQALPNLRGKSHPSARFQFISNANPVDRAMEIIHADFMDSSEALVKVRSLLVLYHYEFLMFDFSTLALCFVVSLY